MAAVGVHCPECVKDAHASAPKMRPAVVTSMRRVGRSDSPVVTYGLIALCVVVFIAQLFTGTGSGVVTQDLAYYPPFTAAQPWRLLTAVFVHGSIIHLLVNMYSLFIFGPLVERLLGRWRYAALFLLAGFGGSVAVLLIAPGIAVVGASGAIFGLLGAFFIIQRHLGGNSMQLVVVILLNFAIPFFIPGIAWQAHVGGLVAGALVALVFVRTRNRSQHTTQLVLLGGVLALLIVATIVGVQLLASRSLG